MLKHVHAQSKRQRICGGNKKSKDERDVKGTERQISEKKNVQE